ncbi:hypothetical protein CF326_g7824 [Tilletia indica]|nr:hypothetical protein CF326_g7824 [Tilletia indica]
MVNNNQDQPEASGSRLHPRPPHNPPQGPQQIRTNGINNFTQAHVHIDQMLMRNEDDNHLATQRQHINSLKRKVSAAELDNKAITERNERLQAELELARQETRSANERAEQAVRLRVEAEEACGEVQADLDRSRDRVRALEAEVEERDGKMEVLTEERDEWRAKFEELATKAQEAAAICQNKGKGEARA